MLKTINGNIPETATIVRIFVYNNIMSKTMEKTKRIDLRASQKDERHLIEASQKLGTNKISATIFKAVETVATMKELFFIDREAIQAIDDLTEYARKHLQAFITEFTAVTGCALTIADLERIFEGIGKLGSKSILAAAITETVSDMLYKQLIAEYPKMTVNPENIPAKDLTSLIAIAEKMDFIPTIRTGSPAVIFWGSFSISDGVISVIDSEVEKLKSAYRFEAETPEELQKLQKVKKICQALNEVIEDPDVIPEAITRLFYFDKQARTFCPSGSYVKYSTAQPQRILFTH